MEEKIDSMEQKRNSLESDLTKEEIYRHPEKARKTKIDFERIKEELEGIYDEWTEASHELEKVVQRFKEI